MKMMGKKCQRFFFVSWKSINFMNFFFLSNFSFWHFFFEKETYRHYHHLKGQNFRESKKPVTIDSDRHGRKQIWRIWCENKHKSYSHTVVVSFFPTIPMILSMIFVPRIYRKKIMTIISHHCSGIEFLNCLPIHSQESLVSVENLKRLNFFLLFLSIIN